MASYKARMEHCFRGMSATEGTSKQRPIRRTQVCGVHGAISKPMARSRDCLAWTLRQPGCPPAERAVRDDKVRGERHEMQIVRKLGASESVIHKHRLIGKPGEFFAAPFEIV